MPTISIRDLARRPSRVVDDVVETGRPAIITRHGKPVGAVVPIDEDQLEDFVLANAPEYVASMDEADEDLVAGQTVSAEDLFEELEQRPER